MPLIDTVNRMFREFRRYTDDGLPGAPVNAPLPVGDPQSGAHNPKKSELRAGFLEILTGIDAAATSAEEDADRAEAAADAAEAALSSVSVTSFATKAAAQAYTPSTAPNYIRLEGYAAAGDSGRSLYKRVVSEPSHAGKFSITAGGATVWFEIAEPRIDPMMLGAVGNGTTDDRAAISSAVAVATALGVPLVIRRPHKIATSPTLNCSEVFFEGGRFIGNGGAEFVSIACPVTAARVKIFDNCNASFSYGAVVYPEWWGAVRDGATDDRPAIVAALAALPLGGEVNFAAGSYAIASNVNVTTNKTYLRGAGQYRTNVIRTGSSAGTAFQFVGTSAAVTLSGCGLFGMHIYQTQAATGGNGVVIQWTSVFKMQDVQVSDFGVAFYLSGAANSQLERCLAANTQGSFNFIGFDIDGTNGGNYSAEFKTCWVEGRGNTGTTTRGFYIHGAVIQDLHFYNCSTQGVRRGTEINGSAAMAANPWGDIIFMGFVPDGYSQYGAYISAVTDVGAINFIGGWFNPTLDGANPCYDAYVTGSRGITFSDIQMQSAGGWNVTHSVYINASQQVKVLGCTITDKYYGMSVIGSEYCQIANNTFFSRTGRTRFADVSLASSVRCGLVGNVHDGPANTGVAVDASCTSIPITACIFNAGTIAARISDPGTKTVQSNNVGT